MSIPPPQIVINLISVGAFTPATGQKQQNNNSGYQLASYPLQNPPQLIGVDSVIATINGTQPVVFPNLPIRGSGNPLAASQNQPKTLTVQPGDLLIFEVGVQGSPGVVSLSANVVDTGNLGHVGPFIGPGTYKMFRVVATTSTPLKLTLWGKLYLQRGVGS